MSLCGWLLQQSEKGRLPKEPKKKVWVFAQEAFGHLYIKELRR